MTAGLARVVVIGASGNVGAGVLRALIAQLPDTAVVGVCRRPPARGRIYESVRWHVVDLSSPLAADLLSPALRNADVVVHLAIAVRPVRDEEYLYRANVLGTQAVLDAVVSAGTKQFVYASSLGIYAPGAGTPVSEDWPDTGQETSTYSRHKVLVERMLDRFALDHPEIAVARFRPTVVVQRQAAWLIRSLYLGPLVPSVALKLLGRRSLPVLPLPAGIELQFVHADDVGDAVVRLMQRRARGSFNIAADALESKDIAELVGARPLSVDPHLARRVVVALSRARLVALTPGWFDVATNTPVMDTSKARKELGWAPTRSSRESAAELIDGLADGAVGMSAATGLKPERQWTFRNTVQLAHGASLLLWGALALTRAVGIGHPRGLDAFVIATNVVSGTPSALRRLGERRRDPVAVMAPPAVVVAVTASLRGGWPPVAACTVLYLLSRIDRNAPRTK